MTSKYFPWTLGAPVARAVFSFSLLLCTAFIVCQPYSRLKSELDDTKSNDQVKSVLRESSVPEEDPELTDAIEQVLDQQNPSASDIKRVKDMITIRALAEGSGGQGKVKDPAAAAKSIRSSPVYHDAGTQQSSNWIGRAYKRFGDLLDRMKQPKVDAPDVSKVGSAGAWLVDIIWVILGAAVLFFLYLALRNFKWFGRHNKKVGGLLDDDEPDRTADEWLAAANELELAGRFREAIRCLYLASLARLDEAGIARFIRQQTNWEHYHRIQSSPKRPPDIDLLPTTKAFDLIWYGHQRCDAQDVALFRSAYQRVLDQLRLQRSA